MSLFKSEPTLLNLLSSLYQITSISKKKTELRLVIKISKKKGGDIAPGKKYTLINNALHSVIKQFTIKLNETLITEQSDTQAYNAYIKTFLNSTEQDKKSYLTKVKHISLNPIYTYTACISLNQF